MMGPKVMLGPTRVPGLEAYISTDTVSAVYAMCISMGLRPHWNPETGVFHIDSPLRDQRVVLGLSAGSRADGIARHVEHVISVAGQAIEAVGGQATVLLPGPRFLSQDPGTDYFVQVVPRGDHGDGSFRVLYSFNRLWESRRLAATIVASARRRWPEMAAKTSFVWNPWLERDAYQALMWRNAPSVRLEWDVGDGWSTTEFVAETLCQCLESVVMTRTRVSDRFVFNEERLGREMSALYERPALARREVSDVLEPDISPAATVTQPEDASSWVSSRQRQWVESSPPLPRALTPQEEQAGRDLARKKRG